jgi:diamine N-acetyltransferase
MINLFKASINDLIPLTELSRKIYQEYYLHLWHTGGAEWYMNEYAYVKDKIEKDLRDNGIEYFILSEGPTYLGYMKINLNALFSGDETKNAMEIERIYLYKAASGKGLGKKMMALAMQRALELKKQLIFLKAMDSSTEAINFYKKMGYVICGSLQLPMPDFSLMKEEYRGMLLLKISVGE